MMFHKYSLIAFLCFVELNVLISAQKSLSGLPCQSSYTRNGKIVGGTNAPRGSTPYIVSLTRRGGHFCGATILNEKYLLTAGHCLCNGLNRIMKPSQIRAVVGLHKISEYKNEIQRSGDYRNAEEIALKDLIVHPDYDCNKVANDIALIELQGPIRFRREVSPICVPSSPSSIIEGAPGIVAGWGWTNEDQNIGDRADQLQQATVEFWENSKCTDSFRRNQKQIEISPTQVCAGKAAGGIDSCFADSGGPLINDQNVIVGIVSTGIGCARPGLPGVYTRVSEYTDWIESVMRR